MRSLVLALGCCLIATGGFAAESRKIDLSQPILEQNGTPAKDGAGRTQEETQADPECKKCPGLTMGRLIAAALYRSASPSPDPRQPPMEFGQVMARAELAKSLHDPLTNEDNKAAALGSAQVKVITEAVAKYFPAPAAVQVVKALDPDYTPPEIK